MPQKILTQVQLIITLKTKYNTNTNLRSVYLSVCLFVCAEFFSAVFDPISIKLGHMLYVWV